MDNMQFCYWLGGYFEISRKRSIEPYLNEDQLKIVKLAIEEVERENPWTCGFIQWLQGVLDATRVLNPKGADYQNLSRAIKMTLDKVFEEEVDKLLDSIEPPEVEPIFPQLVIHKGGSTLVPQKKSVEDVLIKH